MPNPPVAMATFPRWADLLPELVCRIGDRLDLGEYASARGACTAWRRALAPLSPTLVVVPDNPLRWPYAASLPTRRSLELTSIDDGGSRCVGSSNGWLALARERWQTIVVVLLNPIAAVKIVLPPLVHYKVWVSKVVFAPSPAKDDFAAAAICDADRIAYVTAGARSWAVMDPISLTTGDQLIDVVYTDGGKVYCLTRYGDVHVLRLPDRRRRKPAANVDEAGTSEPEVSDVFQQPPQPVERTTNSPPLQLEEHYPKLWMMRYEQLHMTIPPRRISFCTKRSSIPLPPETELPHLNAPATLEPLLSEANLPFNPATAFAPPYDTVCSITSAKNLVFCEGNLYQVWRNASCTVTLKLPAGGRHRVAENEIVVLRYCPRRQPCWDVVKDMGGHSFFVGRNNAVSMYAEGVPGLRGNCVYWIGGSGRDKAMVFDMESGRSTACMAHPVGLLPVHPGSTICWYFLSDVMP